MTYYIRLAMTLVLLSSSGCATSTTHRDRIHWGECLQESMIRGKPNYADAYRCTRR